MAIRFERDPGRCAMFDDSNSNHNNYGNHDDGDNQFRCMKGDRNNM